MIGSPGGEGILVVMAVVSVDLKKLASQAAARRRYEDMIERRGDSETIFHNRGSWTDTFNESLCSR